MTQGKLYKWLDEILTFKQYDANNPVTSTVAEVKDFLDEAKKDFPAEIHKDSVDGNYVLWAKNNDAEYHIEDLANDVADWFKKWFGDANP